MPTQETEVLASKIARAADRVQGDLFGPDPAHRAALKARLSRGTAWLRQLRQQNADVAAELITLNAIAARDCFEKRDYEGLARHSSLVLQYTLPRLNAAVLTPGAPGQQGGALVMQWQEPAPDAPQPADVIDA